RRAASRDRLPADFRWRARRCGAVAAAQIGRARRQQPHLVAGGRGRRHRCHRGHALRRPDVGALSLAQAAISLARLAGGAPGRSRQAQRANRALYRHGRGSRVALSAERQRRRRGGAGRTGIRRHRGGARRRSRRARQCPPNRGRWRRRTSCDPTPGQTLARENLLHAVILRSSVAHGRIRSIETAAARARPGVHAVITAADIGAVVPAIPLRQDSSPAFTPFEQPVIAHDKVRYVGEPVAVVLAASAATAEDALDAITLAIEPLPAVVTSADAATDDILLFEAAPSNRALTL